jgi:hypothetical protein
MWFKPKPICLKYGEPIHQMVARALYCDAIVVRGGLIPRVHYHFIGPHGVEYKGSNGNLTDTWTKIAIICERVQSDFNERTAAMDKAREYARDKIAVPPLFESLTEGKPPQ